MKDPRADCASGSLQTFGDGALVAQNLSQGVSHRERTSLLVLGGPGVEFDFFGREVHLSPLECLDLTLDTPAGDVCESQQHGYVIRDLTNDGLKLVALKESSTDVVLVQHRNVGAVEEFSRSNGQ